MARRGGTPIAAHAFKRRFQLSDHVFIHVFVKSTRRSRTGCLHADLECEILEAMKPRQILIG
jgi:hypothetical protein